MLVSTTPTSITLDIPAGDQIQILVVDDSESDVVLIRDLLEAAGADGWCIDWQSTIEAGIEALHSRAYHACLVDMRLGARTGLDLIRSVAGEATIVPIIALTGLESREVDLAAMEAGATDYLCKVELTGSKLERTIRYAIERARGRADLIRRARRDALTGLHNRASIEEYIGHAAARTERLGTLMGVALLDLDGFKAVNDQLGHAVGDQLLQHVANRLVAGVRPYDAVGRLGGDEFVVVFQDLGNEQLGTDIAERLVRDLRAPYSIRGRPQVSASVGLATYAGGTEETPDDLIRRADTAMYAAKRAGKAQAVVYRGLALVAGGESPASSSVPVEALAIECRLEPQMELRTGAIVGAELHQDLDHESSDLTSDLLSEAQHRLQVELKGMSITLKCSPEVLLQNDKPSEIAQLIPDDDRGRVELELVESNLKTHQLTQLAEVLDQLRSHHVRIRLGGFGMGRSLWLLSKLPIDSVRIHEDITSSLLGFGDQACVEGLAHMGHRAGCQVVVGRISSEEQLHQLRGLGVDLVQGQASALGCVLET